MHNVNPYTLQERLIDMQKKTGHIYHRVHYLKYKKPVRQAKKNKSSQPENNNENDAQDDTQSNAAIDELSFLLFFKSCIVERDFEELKKRLEQSIDMREKLINAKNTEFHKLFPFYFIEPLLVSTFWNEWMIEIVQKIMYSFIYRFFSISQSATNPLIPMCCSTNGQQWKPMCSRILIRPTETIFWTTSMTKLAITFVCWNSWCQLVSICRISLANWSFFRM